MGEDEEDIHLLRRVAWRDEEALLHLYRRYAPRVQGLKKTSAQAFLGGAFPAWCARRDSNPRPRA
jgi:hypothetical protein